LDNLIENDYEYFELLQMGYTSNSINNLEVDKLIKIHTPLEILFISKNINIPLIDNSTTTIDKKNNHFLIFLEKEGINPTTYQLFSFRLKIISILQPDEDIKNDPRHYKNITIKNSKKWIYRNIIIPN
jgi:hypothetical protein